jgi:sugar (pentulose or hexulose) kinase
MPAVHDTACAYAAAPIKPGCNSLIVSSGTWVLAGVNLSEPILSQSAFDAGFSNEAGIDGEIRFLRNVMGTWPAQQLRQLWSRQDKKELSWDDFDKIALAGYPGKCVIDIDNPMFYDSSNMELTIYQYCKATGQKQPTSRSELACAVYQSLALKISLVAEDISMLIGKPIEEILLLGGATRSSVLCQWIADAAGLYLRTGPAEATAFGNAILQAKALGWIKTIKEGRELIGMSYRDKVFSAKNSEFWREMKSTFRKQIQNT